MFALVVHGLSSHVFEETIRLLNSLTRFGEVTCTAVGTSCIKPIHDLGLQDSITFFSFDTMSDAISSLSEQYEAIICHNESKNLESSERFRSIIKTRIASVRCPVLYIDNHVASYLTECRHAIFEEVLDQFAIQLVETTLRKDHLVREVHGALVGENIWINGNVVGTVVKPYPKIWRDEDNEIKYYGIKLKEHGLFHVGDFNPIDAKIRTGFSASNESMPRCSKTDKKPIASIIDHDAEKGVRYSSHAQYAVSIGDDTTKNASSLLYRFSVPIIGITDGDEDGICPEDIRYPGSVIFKVIPGHDDIVGSEVSRELFRGATTIKDPPGIEAMADMIQDLIGGRLVSRYDETFHSDKQIDSNS